MTCLFVLQPLLFIQLIIQNIFGLIGKGIWQKSTLQKAKRVWEEYQENAPNHPVTPFYETNTSKDLDDFD